MGIIELKRTISEKTAEFKRYVEQITAEKRSFSDEEQGKVDALEREINASHSQLRALEKVSDFERSLPETNKEMGAPGFITSKTYKVLKQVVGKWPKNQVLSHQKLTRY